MAQNLILCQFCEISNNVKWKCIVCDLKLCERCKINHSKFKGSEDHCIIDVAKVNPIQNAEIIRKLDLKNIVCLSHEEEKCSLFCKNCNKPVCSFCILESSHNGHDIQKVGLVYDSQVIELKGLKNKIENDLTLISKSVNQSINPIENYLEIKTKIDRRENELKENATKQAEKLICELHKVHTQNLAKKQDIEERESNMKKMEKEIDKALKSHEASMVLATIGKVNTDLPLEMDLDNQLYQKLSFILPDSPNDNLGHLIKCPTFQIVKSYDTTIPSIHEMQSLQDGTLICIFERDDNTLLGYCNIRGDKFVLEKETKLDILRIKDMTVTGDNKILFTTGSDEIKYMKAYGKELSTFEITNYWGNRFLRGIHSTDHGVLVGFFQYEHDFDEDNYCDEIISTGIMFLNSNGYRSSTYKRIETIHHGGILFSYLDKLTTNINGDINILDSGRVVVLGGYNFRVKWMYTANTCTDIVTTSEGLVVVACHSTNKIIILSMEGDVLTSIEERDGIYHPTALYLDMSGQILIGCEGKEDEKSRIHVVKIS